MTRIQTDLARLLSICAVLIIHATGQIEAVFAQTHSFQSAEFAGVLLNQWSRFSVPIFVLLSGYGLGMRYRTSFELREFMERRFTRIGVPFLVWTAVFILVYRVSWNQALLTSSGLADALQDVLRELPHALLTRGADYHFYFFIIILQCYLAFGILRRTDVRTLVVLGILHLLITSPSSKMLHHAGLLPGWHASFIVNWVFYFALGIHFSKSMPPPGRLAAALAAVVSLAAVCAEFVYYALQPDGIETGNYDHFARWSVAFYAIAALFFLASFTDRPIEGSLKTWIERGAGLSFAVFIFHTTILRLLEMTPLRATLLIIPALITASLALVWILDFVLRPAWLRIIFGLPETRS